MARSSSPAPLAALPSLVPGMCKTPRPPRVQFGMFQWRPGGSQQRTPRPSVALLEKWFRELPGRVAQLRKQQREQEAAAAGVEDGRAVDGRVGALAGQQQPRQRSGKLAYA